jgi:hypothetical protein
VIKSSLKVDFMVKFELADTTVVIETMSGKLKWSDLQFLWK